MGIKFKKNDQVIIISGSNKGLFGRILSFKGSRVTVSGANLATIHKNSTQSQPGQIIKRELPLHISNISHVENGKPIKVKYLLLDGKKERFSKKTSQKIPTA